MQEAIPFASSFYLQGLDALMMALQKWNGGVIIISHDEKFITTVANQVSFGGLHILSTNSYNPLQLWVCGEGTVKQFKGDVQAYKVLK